LLLHPFNGMMLCLSFTRSPTFTYNLQRLCPETYCALNTNPLNYSGWSNSIMKFHHNTQPSEHDAIVNGVEFYQVTDFHLPSPSFPG
jgi:hypothetical protein